MRRLIKLPAMLGAAALLTTGLAPAAFVPAAFSAPSAADTAQAMTTATLADSSAAQQRWLSVAESRTVLNPYYFSDAADGTSELSYTGGNNLPLATAFYAHDKALHVKETLTTYASGEAPPQDLINEGFDAQPSGWILGNAAANYAGGKVTVSNSGAQWGYLATPELALNPAVHSKLRIKIDATSPATVGKWGIKINPVGSGDDLSPALQPDTTSTGEFTYDLGKYFAEQGKTGIQNVRIRIWATTYETGQSTVSYTLDSFRLYRGATPEDGQLVVGANEFDSSSGWTTSDQNPPLALSTSGSKGTFSLPANSPRDYDFLLSGGTSLNLDRTPMLTVKVDSRTGGQWALKVSDQSSGASDKTIQADTEATGTFSYNLKDLTGWTGTKTVYLKIFQVGKGTSTTFDRYAYHSGGTSAAVATATSVDYTWDPAADYSTGHYGSGDIKVSDYFSAGHLDGTVRKIETSVAGNAIVAGVIERTGSSYDATTNVITIPGTWATRAIALPAGATVQFYASKQAFVAGSNPSASAPTGTGFWAATLPAGTSPTYVGIGWAVNTGKSDDHELADLPVWTNPYPGGAAAEAAKFATDSRDEGSAGIDHWAAHWDDYMGRVPEVQDYSIQRVATGGITAAQMEAFYYRAFLNLEMNVLPATPETGNDYLQVGTGKPSLWMSGTPGTRNVASWDSLLGMQQLAYTNPNASWDSFIGMMNAVQMSGPAPTDANGVAAKGALKGESLPSRKAQTAWILYSVTGDLTKLESVYDQLQANLIWSSHNMRWIYGSNNYTDERDSEFVASLIYDLKFGARIAELLGHSGDVTTFNNLISTLTDDYEDWFFPTPGGTAPTFQTVQKVFLDSSRTSSPWSDPTEGSDYRDHKNRWVKNGWSFYTTTALVAHDLEPEFKAKVMNRFMKDYKANSQLAGLGDFAVKAPDIQLITYGLLDAAAWGSGSNAGYSWPAVTRADLIDAATVLVNAFNRDMVKSGFFAEVYEQTDPGTDVSAPIKSRGVRPSLFGVSHYIDNVWIANGYRVDEGDPTFVRLSGATGGLKGLTYMGKTFDLDIVGNQIQLSGAAVGGTVGLPATVDVSQIGEPVAPGTNPTTVSSDATLATLTYGGKPVPGFTPATTNYDVVLPYGTTPVPTVAATSAHPGASLEITQAGSLDGTATVRVTAEDNTTTRTYQIHFAAGEMPPTFVTLKAPTRVSSTFGRTAKFSVVVTGGDTAIDGTLTTTAGSKVVATTSIKQGRAVVALPSTLPVGTHTLTTTLTAANVTGVMTAPVTTIVTIKKASARVASAKILKGKAGNNAKAARSLKRGKAGLVQVRIVGIAAGTPTGTVTLKAGAKTLGKAKVKKSGKKYVATIKVKAKATRKIKKTTKIKVVYSGNANLAKLTAKTKLRVVR